MVETIRKHYLENMEKLYTDKTCSGPWTRKWVEEIITMIQNNLDVPDRKWSMYQTNLKDMYIITLKDLNYELMRVLKSHDGNVSIVPVVPWEDAFDIIWEAHISCGHGDLTKTMNVLKLNYFINLIFVVTVLKACNCQKEKVVSDSTKYNDVGSIQILDMSPYRDKGFNYVLFYDDIQTGLIQLRPLAQVNQLEISLELVKIFTDLGPPRKIIVYEPYFYDNVIDNVNKVFSPCKIDLEFDVVTNERLTSQNDRVRLVYAKFREWMKVNKSKNWIIGCYLVQWKINVTQNVDTIPYHLVFGNKSNIAKKKGTFTSSKNLVDRINPTEANENDPLNLEGSNTDQIMSETQGEIDIICLSDTSLDGENNTKTNIKEYNNSQLNLHATSSYSDEYIKNKDLVKFPSNFPSDQETISNNSNIDIKMISVFETDNKKCITPIEMKLLSDEEKMGLDNTEMTSTELINAELQPVTLPHDAQCQETTETTDTVFVCWRCENKVDCSKKMQDGVLNIADIVCSSCMNVDEDIIKFETKHDLNETISNI